MEVTFLGVTIDLLGVLAAAVSSMVIGFTFFLKPVFGRKWQGLVKLTDEQAQAKAMSSLLIAIVGAFVVAFLLAVLFPLGLFNGYSEVESALVASLLGWAFYAVPSLINFAYAQRSMTLWLLEVGNQLVTFIVMAQVYRLVA